MNGWIKLHRKILDNPIVTKDADYLAVWVYLLLSATHEEYSALFMGSKITLKPGQLITGRKSIAEHLSINESKVKRILIDFENDQQIGRQRSNKNSLISILNWEKYQFVDQQSDQQMTNERPADDQQMTNERPASDHKQEYKNVRTEEGKNERTILTVSNDTVCQTDVRRIVDEWNALQSFGIQPISKLSSGSKRYKNLIARLKQYGVEDVLKAIDRIKISDFCQGKNKNGWIITFDWFVLPNNFPKVLEGNYDNRVINNTYQGNVNDSRQTQLNYLLDSIRKDEVNDRS